MANATMIADTEMVARLLHREWVVDGILQHYAFVLRRNESYISVNRPAIPSYKTDVVSFVESHPGFYADGSRTNYMCALLNVGKIRQTEILVNGIQLNVDVEVEPRSSFAKSHAGIFTRHEGQNVKVGESFWFDNCIEEVSSDAILLEVRSHLLNLAQLECNSLHQSD